MVNESNDRMCVLNKPVIVWWACAGMSHSSDVETLLLPDEFPSRCFTNGGTPSSPVLSPASTSTEPNIQSKKEGDETGKETEKKSSGNRAKETEGIKGVSVVEKINVFLSQDE